jgi:hypothetical protein
VIDRAPWSVALCGKLQVTDRNAASKDPPWFADDALKDRVAKLIQPLSNSPQTATAGAKL